jgi:hypothetical protein
MSEVKFTPGPWHREPDHPVTGYADIDDHIVGADGCTVADCYGPRELQPERVNLPLAEQCRANAHLIAAAPDLYEALQGMFDLVCVLGYKLGNGERPILKDGVVDQKMMATRAALAKASADSIQGGG